MIARICLAVTAFCIVRVNAFAPTVSTNKNNGMIRPTFIFQQAHVVPSCTRVSKITIRSMSSTEPEADSTSDATTATTAESKDGTFYDDEVNYSHVILYSIKNEYPSPNEHLYHPDCIVIDVGRTCCHEGWYLRNHERTLDT
jgi:hypothetical protein